MNFIVSHLQSCAATGAASIASKSSSSSSEAAAMVLRLHCTSFPLIGTLPGPRSTRCARVIPTRSRSLRYSSASLFVDVAFKGGMHVRASDRGGGAARVTMAAAGGEEDTPGTETMPFGVLFVCLGNICRSPSAEAVFRSTVEKRGLSAKFNIDSAGTIDYHEGNPADSRMKAAALKRGVKLTSISRPIRRSDFEEFDLILAMDKSNRADILEAYETWNRRTPLPANAEDKVKLMCSYCSKHAIDEVPDPYYGGPAGFEKVLDLLDDACEGLMEAIQSLQAQEDLNRVKSSS